MTRFVWRERAERVNWRLLRELQLADVVRRGDATLLEPYALHLTFAKLPVVVHTLSSSSSSSRREAHDDDAWAGTGDTSRNHHAHNAWFIVRVFQLAMEYLLFLRARDGTVVDSLREELLVCERECELLVERARKWKDRSRSGDRQVEKLHQVLQNIAKLLQIEGATPHAVSTIESLLRELVPSASKRRSNGGHSQQHEPSFSHVEEARVCALCGKMFSSQEFLDKHAIRRHPGVDAKTIHDDGRKRSRPTRSATDDAVSNQIDVKTDHTHDMRAMLRAVEQTLQDHQASLRTVAQEEADKLHNLYEQLHVETQLAEEMRTKRVAIEKDVEKRRHELDAIEQEKEDAVEELRMVKEQLEFLVMKKKIETQNGVTSPPPTQHDPTLQLEMKRLEETVVVLKDALSTARGELQRTHESHGALLKEKAALESQLHEANNHASRLEASLRGVHTHVPTMRVDVGVLTTIVTASSATQTDNEKPETIPTVVIPPPRVAAGEAAVQTEEQQDRAERIDTMMQTEPEAVPPPAEIVQARSPTTSIGVGVENDLVGDEDLDSVFKLKCASILDLVQRRADRSAHTQATSSTGRQNEEKIFNSLPRRRYLRSRFLHDERIVGDRIASHVAKLEQSSLRYGVSPKSLVLANEHVEVVLRALHAHLEVLPAEVLKRMIEIEDTANALIQSHWMPQEKSRQQALQRLTTGLEAKSQVNQGLVRQAMISFASNVSADKEVGRAAAPTTEDKAHWLLGKAEKEEKDETSLPINDNKESRSRPHDEDTDQSTGNVQIEAAKVAEGDGQDECQRALQLADKKTMNESTISAAEADRHMPATELEAVLETRPLTPPPAFTEPLSSQHRGEPSPVSVQDVRRQAIAVRSVKVVSVSPKSSPPKSPLRAQSSEPRGSPIARMNVLAVVSEDDDPRNQAAAPTVDVLIPIEDEDAAHRAGTTIASVQAVQASGTSMTHHRGPSSFSAKHPESQLGIVIPSRYDPSTINVHGVRDDSDVVDVDDFRHRQPSAQELRWSSSAGRSGGVSDQLFSGESSELSFDASIPSLASEGVGVSRSFPRSSTEQLPTVLSEAEEEKELDPIPDKTDALAITDIHDIESIGDDASDLEENTVQSLVVEQRDSPSPTPQHSPRLSPRPNEIMAFDDDSDIEEVMLA